MAMVTRDSVACVFWSPRCWVLTHISVPGSQAGGVLWWEFLPNLTPRPPHGALGRRSVVTLRGGNGSSLSKIKVTSLLDEVPVDLWCSHIKVWSVDRFINRKQFLLGHPHLLCFSFQFHLDA